VTSQILDIVIRLVRLILGVKEKLEELVKLLLRLNVSDGAKICDAVILSDRSRRPDLLSASVKENSCVFVPRFVRENACVDENDRDREKVRDLLNISEGSMKLESSNSGVRDNHKVCDRAFV
jgi:hypothetical protein